MIENIGAKIDIIGRDSDLHKLFEKLRMKRLICLIGFMGVGKSSLVRNAIHRLSQRRQFQRGIVLVPLKGVDSLESIVNLIFKKLQLQFV